MGLVFTRINPESLQPGNDQVTTITFVHQESNQCNPANVLPWINPR